MPVVTLNKWGNATGFRIPQAFLNQLGLKAGDKVHIDLRNNTLVISPAGPTLEDLLTQITDSNRHEEYFTDVAGKESL